MASLAIVTRETRIWLKYAGIGLVFLLMLIFFIRGLIFVKEIFFPSKPPAPKQEFGKLAKYFNKSQEAANINYRINTIDGTLPILPDRMNVYKLKQFQPSLLSLESAKNKINRNFIKSNPIKISDTIYEWNEAEKGINLQYNIINGNYSVSSNYLDNPTLTEASISQSSDNIIKGVEDYLKSFESDTSDLDFKSSTVTYLQLIERRLEPAKNLGSAKLAKVDIKQKMVDETPIIYGDPNDSNISFIVTYPNQNFTVVEGQYYHYLPILDQKSDYPIKTSIQAFDDLKSGNARVFNPNNLINVDITDVHLKYYLDKNTNAYLQPIIVFTGINFTAYVDAIPQESLQ